MSAEERPVVAALARAAEALLLANEHNRPNIEPRWALREALDNYVAERVGVPTEPGAPDHPHRRVRMDDPAWKPEWAHYDWHCRCGWWGNLGSEGYAAHLENLLASRPVPAPEPSAPLSCCDEYRANAATPQDPEA